MVYYDPRKPKPWPIRILNKFGVTNDTTATHVVIVVSIVFLLVAGLLQLNTNTEEQIERTLSPEELRSIGL